MKFDQIEVGKKYKNYKELCKTLGVKPKTSNSKISQMKEIDSMLVYHKEGYGFIIDEIKLTADKIEDGREKGNNSIPYLDLVERLILDLMLRDKDNNKIFLSKSKMFKALKMVNNNYSVGKMNIPELSKVIDLDKRITEDWYSSTDSMLEGHIVSSLNSLASQSLVVWSKVNTIDVDTVINRTLLQAQDIRYDDNGNKLVTYIETPMTRREHREATDEEDLIISRAERNALIQLKCENKADVINGKHWDSFSDMVSKEIMEKANIRFYYKSYKILFHKDLIQDKANQMDQMELDDTARMDTEFNLSYSIQDRILENARSRKYKALDQSDFKNEHRLFDDYVSDNDKLNKILLDQLTGSEIIERVIREREKL